MGREHHAQCDRHQQGPGKAAACARQAKQQATERRDREQKEQHSRELEAVLQEQAREREAYERRRALMLFQQAGALQHFEERMGDKSSLQQEFAVHTAYVEANRERREPTTETKARQQGRDHDGPELV